MCFGPERSAGSVPDEVIEARWLSEPAFEALGSAENGDGLVVSVATPGISGTRRTRSASGR
jgi:hypothetical protein